MEEEIKTYVLVVGVVEPGVDGDAVLEVVAEGVGRVVDDGDVGLREIGRGSSRYEVSSQDGQVLDVVAIYDNARVTEHSVSRRRAGRGDHTLCTSSGGPECLAACPHS